VVPLVRRLGQEFFNQRWLELYGVYLREQALGSGWQVAIHSDDLPEFWKNIPRKALNSVKPYEVGGPLSAVSTAEFAGFSFAVVLLRDRSGESREVVTEQYRS